mmetsp:Transcript_109324/g.293468  ORF Transcript_109324/g.293468 Transcript_109324/m.293468 type:complete len:113 (+) Transcript_109324:108-446(+)
MRRRRATTTKTTTKTTGAPSTLGAVSGANRLCQGTAARRGASHPAGQQGNSGEMARAIDLSLAANTPGLNNQEAFYAMPRQSKSIGAKQSWDISQEACAQGLGRRTKPRRRP